MEGFEDFIPAIEAAVIVDQKEQTLTTWRSEGRGPIFYKIGRKVFYRRADIMCWLATRRRDPIRKVS